MPRRSSGVKTSSDRPQKQTSLRKAEICGCPRRNAIISFEQTSELCNDSDDETIIDHDSEDNNDEHPIPVTTAITPVLVINIIV